MPHDLDAISQLPDDAHLLKQHLRVSEGEVRRLKLMVDKLTLQLARRVRSQFGTSSERFDDGQTSLIEPAVLDELAPSRRPAAAANAGQLDRSLPDHLPRETHEIRPEVAASHHDAQGQACGCLACGARLRLLGTDVAHHLEYVPGRFKVVRTVRPKLACTKCETIFQASAPVRPIPRGLAGAGLLAHVAVSKYCDQLETKPLAHAQVPQHCRRAAYSSIRRPWMPLLRRRNSRLLLRYSSVVAIVVFVVEDGGRMNYAEPITPQTAEIREKGRPLGIVRRSA